MKFYKIIKESGVLLLLILTLNGCQNTNTKKIEQLAMAEVMVGVWNQNETNSFEIWWKNENNEYVGKVINVTDGDTMLLENVAILKQGNEIYYQATVANQNEQKPVQFLLTASQPDLLIFENPDHDFPNIIRYELIDKDEMRAIINGKGEQSTPRIFEYQRVK